jgi:hypothetical protein
MSKDEALKMAIGFAETSSSISGELYYQYRDIVINACKEALEQQATNINYDLYRNVDMPVNPEWYKK